MKENRYYTVEQNVQIVISLLKQNGIKRIIVSPGTTNMTFVGSIQNDPFFEIYSSPDERSAAYLACGMSSETGEPVVISCTGASASRNYMPGLTEAFYRKLPIIAITSHRGDSEIGHLIEQQIDRRKIPSDVALVSVTAPIVKDVKAEKYCIDEVNKALIVSKSSGGGPVHINLHTEYSRDFSVKYLPEARCIRKYTSFDDLPDLPKGRVAVSIGAHQPFSNKEIEAIESFCASNNAVVFTSHISGYRGRYSVNFSLVRAQKNYNSPLSNPDLIISIGEISGTPFRIKGKEVWRVSIDGQLRDTYGNLSKVFQMPESYFFNYYSRNDGTDTKYVDECNYELEKVRSLIKDIPFSNPWVAMRLGNNLPKGCALHLGILNTLRSWNLFPLTEGIYARCNVGAYGIDGGVSALIGASIARPDKLFFGVFGDLAFFYDMNVLGNRHVGKNVRIIIVNNGRGTEFRNSFHPCSIFGEDADPFMASAGHYGNKSPLLLKHYAEDLGFLYLSASSKDEFNKFLPLVVSPQIGNRAILIELFTDSNYENEALETLFHLVDPSIGEKAKRVVKNIIPASVSKEIKKLKKN